MPQQARIDPRRILPLWAPRPQPVPSLWHRWDSADLGGDPVHTDVDETPPERARVKAYLMIQADPRRVHQVLEEVRSLEVVTEAHEMTGPFDIVAFIEADGVTDLPPLLCKVTFTMQGVYAAAAVPAESASWREKRTAPNG